METYRQGRALTCESLDEDLHGELVLVGNGVYVRCSLNLVVWQVRAESIFPFIVKCVAEMTLDQLNCSNPRVDDKRWSLCR